MMCGLDTVVDLVTRPRDAQVREPASNVQKFAFKCCARHICAACLGRLGTRIAKDGPSLRDIHSEETNLFLDFCRERPWTPKHRLDDATLRDADFAGPHPPSVTHCEDLAPRWRGLRCPVCVRSPSATHASKRRRKRRSEKSVRQAAAPGDFSAAASAAAPATSSAPATPFPQHPLPSLPATADTVTVTYMELSADGQEREKTTKVSLVFLPALADAPGLPKGAYAPYSVVRNPARFLPPAANDEEWTLIYGGAGDLRRTGGEIQLISLKHNKRLAEILARIGRASGKSAEEVAAAIHEQVMADMPPNKEGRTTKRTSGANGPLDFARMLRSVSLEVGRANVLFVQTSAVACAVYYISPVDLNGAATLVGNATRGGGTLPSVRKFEHVYSKVYADFLDEFAADRVNAARVVRAVNKQRKLTIAAQSVEAAERQFERALRDAVGLRGRAGKNSSAAQAPSWNGPLTRNRALARELLTHNGTRSAKAARVAELLKRRIGAVGEDKVPAKIAETRGAAACAAAAPAAPSLSRVADRRRVANPAARRDAMRRLSSANEVTVVSDPVGKHVDTFNGRKATGFENKAVFTFPTGAPSAGPQRVPGRGLGGRLFYPVQGVCTFCRPNIDLEYHVLGGTPHAGSTPKFWSEGRGGGGPGKFTFALCDHPRADTTAEAEGPGGRVAAAIAGAVQGVLGVFGVGGT
jgi:hypothetical protein